MSRKTITLIIILLSLAGAMIASYSFLHNRSFAPGSFCNLNETFNCDIVNKGPYADIAGIPVALIGVLGYVFLLLGAALQLRTPTDKQLSLFLLLASLAGLDFSLYLTAIEAFVLHAWCLLCLTSQFIILGIVGLSARLFFLNRMQKPLPEPPLL